MKADQSKSMQTVAILSFTVVVGLLIFRKSIKELITDTDKLSWKDFKIERTKKPIVYNKSTKIRGITVMHAGTGRGEAFLALRKKAKKRILIMGIGMGDLTHTALENLKSQAENVNIDLLMMDPTYLREFPEFARQLEIFFKKGDFTRLVNESFETLKTLCTEWNKDGNNLYKFRLRLYCNVPTMTMVLIDPDGPGAEILFEAFLPYSGERSRFLIVKRQQSEFFEWFHNDLNELWNKSRDGLI